MILENVIKDAEEMAEIEYGNAQVYDKMKNYKLYLPNKITCEQAAKIGEVLNGNDESGSN